MASYDGMAMNIELEKMREAGRKRSWYQNATPEFACMD
jgi:hypothetical protein